jgi:hypothetical protein
MTRIGYVSQFTDITRQAVLTKTEGTVGMTGEHASTAHVRRERPRLHNRYRPARRSAAQQAASTAAATLNPKN